MIEKSCRGPTTAMTLPGSLPKASCGNNLNAVGQAPSFRLDHDATLTGGRRRDATRSSSRWSKV